MRVLVVGGDGRAHALAWALRRSPAVQEVVSAPGNPGMAAIGPVLDVPVDDLDGLADLAERERIDLTVVSPEMPLVAGIVDRFVARGLRVFGPSAAAAEIEGSKVFASGLAHRHGIPMAAGERFAEPDAAFDYVRTLPAPIVVKADGLAAGKGVLVCADHDAARAAIDEIMRTRAFGDAGAQVLIQEFMEGAEMSFFAVTDGREALVLEPAQDYKRALDGDGGLNTGGMGSYSPVPWLGRDVRERVEREILRPLVAAMADEGRPFRGCLYAGVMLTRQGPRLFEVNCRFGDPETQVLLRRLDSDLADVLLACAEGDLGPRTLRWRPDAAVCVAIASAGYPQRSTSGVPIEGIEDAERLEGVVVFQAGTALSDGRLVSAGGRVLNVTATGASIADARERAYEAVSRIRMDGMHARTDIAAGV